MIFIENRTAIANWFSFRESQIRAVDTKTFHTSLASKSWLESSEKYLKCFYPLFGNFANSIGNLSRQMTDLKCDRIPTSEYVTAHIIIENKNLREKKRAPYVQRTPYTRVLYFPKSKLLNRTILLFQFERNRRMTTTIITRPI